MGNSSAKLPSPAANAKSLIASRDAFQRALLDWYRVHHRKLPWRDSPSIYKTVVSELMLQQTQVKTVLPYFARWLDALPDFAALAAAPEARVLKLWEGLGYYSRARNLHKLAQTIAALPAVPRTPAEWIELPGVGPYTAAAVTSISFGAHAAVVDGNVVRILARLTADATEFKDNTTAVKTFTPLASALLNLSTPGDHNQAMMELGATICQRHNPLCTVCPVFAFCAGQKSGDPENFPRLAQKKIEHLAVTRAWILHDGKLLLHRAAAGAKRFANMHELPAHADLGLDEETLLAAPLLARKKRGITRYQISESIHAFTPDAATRRRLANTPALHWIPLADLDTITLSGPHRRWVTEISRGVAPGSG